MLKGFLVTEGAATLSVMRSIIRISSQKKNGIKLNDERGLEPGIRIVRSSYQ